MTTFILPVGFDTRRVTRPIISHGLSPTDQIVLVRPSDDTTAESDSPSSQAIADIRNFVDEIEPNATVTVEHVTRDSWTSTVVECTDLIAAATDPVLGLCGGPRDILLPMTVAGILHAPALIQAYVFSDIDQTVEKWKLPHLTVSIPNSTRNTLQLLAEHAPCSLSELDRLSDNSKSTIARHLDTLENNDAARTWSEGKHRYAELTESAIVLANGPTNFVDP